MTIRTLTRSSLAIVITLAVALWPAGAAAQTCQSAAQVTADLWDEYGDVARAIGCAGSTAAAAAGSMGATLPASVKMYDRCMKTTNEIDKTSRRMISAWNKMADNSWAQIGPRQLEIGSDYEGTVRSTLQRTYVTPHPVLFDTISFAMTKERFRGKTSVTVCKSLPNGDPEPIWHFTMDKGLDNKDKVWLKELNGVAGHLLTVVIDGKSAAKSMKYSLGTVGRDSIVSDESPTRTDVATPGPEMVGVGDDAGLDAPALSRDEFANRDRQLFDSGMRIVDLERVGSGYAGVWRAGDGAQYWRTALSGEELATHTTNHAERGLLLHDLEIGPDGYTAVWRPGSGEQWAGHSMSLDELMDRDRALFDQGMRLVDVEFRDGEYAAVWRTGKGAQWWRHSMSLEELKQEDAKHFDNGLRLAELEKTPAGYLAVWRPGNGGQWWNRAMSLDTFVDHQSRHRNNGLGPVDVEVTADGYLALWRPADGHTTLHMTPGGSAFASR